MDEDYENKEGRTKTLTFEVLEDQFDYPVEAILKSLINDKADRYSSEGDRKILDARTAILVDAIWEFAELTRGKQWVEKAYEDGIKELRRLAKEGHPVNRSDRQYLQDVDLDPLMNDNPAGDLDL